MTTRKNLTILLVEDENDLRCATAAFLELYFSRVISAANGREALDLFDRERPDLVISDIRMPVMDGLEFAARLKTISPDTPVIFCTAFTETAYLIKAIELGVAAFVHKPVDTDELLIVIAKAAEPILQRREITDLSSELSSSLSARLGAGPALQTLSEQVTRVAHTPFNILLTGETGSGKSYLARIIHIISPRRSGPFVSAQLAALPEQLAESELFGHVKGAFTGAIRTKIGLTEKAQNGTLLLDDVDACPPMIQAKLLRFVEEKCFIPVGSTTEKTGDVRIIAASNRNLKQAVLEGRFREDLFYRLTDFVIALPPLREIPDAIIPLAYRLLQETCDELGRDLPFLDEEVRNLLATFTWPGNIRQLKSVIRRALIVDDVITAAAVKTAMGGSDQTPVLPLAYGPDVTGPPPFPCSMEILEKWSLEQAMRYCGGKRMKTATMLGMNYYTFRRRLEKYGIAADMEET